MMSSSTFAQPPAEVLKPSSSSSVVKCFLLSSLNRFCLLFGLCAHVTLVLVFRVRCPCALCASLSGIMSDRPAARPEPTAGDSQRHRLPTSFERYFLPSSSYQRSMTSSTSLQRSISQPIASQRSVPALTIAQRSVQSSNSPSRSLQSLSSSSIQRRTQLLTSTERSMQPTSASSGIPSSAGAHRNTPSAVTDVLVMFQPPYAVQDVVDAELKCAMLTIIDRMCGRDLFHRRCAALQHYCEEPPAVTMAPSKPPTKSIWGPQQSSLQRTYPWMLPNKLSALDQQLDSQMRNLWSAPPAFNQPVPKTSNVDTRINVGGGSLPALFTSMCWHTHDVQAAVRQVTEQSAQSVSAIVTVDSGVSQSDVPAPILTDTSAQPTTCQSPPHTEAAVNQKLAIQTELELTIVEPPSSPSGASSVDSEATCISSLAASDFARSIESVVAPEDAQPELAPEDTLSVGEPDDVQSVLAPEDAQQELRMLLKQKQLKALQEKQEMQQRQLQAMREKRASKKKKRQKEKKRKQLHQLQHLQKSQVNHEEETQLHKSSEE